MRTERPDVQLWQDGEWRCVWGLVGSKQRIRLYFGGYLIGELVSGPKLDVWRQEYYWRAAALADSQRGFTTPRAGS